MNFFYKIINLNLIKPLDLTASLLEKKEAQSNILSGLSVTNSGGGGDPPKSGCVGYLGTCDANNSSGASLPSTGAVRAVALSSLYNSRSSILELKAAWLCCERNYFLMSVTLFLLP